MNDRKLARIRITQGNLSLKLFQNVFVWISALHECLAFPPTQALSEAVQESFESSFAALFP
jgi:hypothetical protein